MSKNRNRAKLNKAQTSKEYKNILMNELYPIYWDECISFYPKYRLGYKNSNKQIFYYKVREYRTWKYNKKKQYEKNKVHKA